MYLYLISYLVVILLILWPARNNYNLEYLIFGYKF
jgi:hypothetical protein